VTRHGSIGDDPVTRFLEADPVLQNLSYRHEVQKAVLRTRRAVLEFDPTRVAESVDDFSRLDALRADLDAWFTKLDQARQAMNVANVIKLPRQGSGDAP
jgi:predicted component of type VI protein secretion system